MENKKRSKINYQLFLRCIVMRASCHHVFDRNLGLWYWFLHTRARFKLFNNSTIKEKLRQLHYITVLSYLFKEGPDQSHKKQIKMKFLIVFALCIVAALAAPPTADVQILKNDFENIGVDGYKFAYVEKLWNQKWKKIVKLKIIEKLKFFQ